jgi:Ni,Fe-hydrogenase III small subunit
MPDYVRTRLAQGANTLEFPGDVAFPARFRGRPVLRCDGCRADACRHQGAHAPSALIRADDAGHAVLDVGACLYAPEEAGGTAECGITFTQDHRLAVTEREDFVSPTGEIELAAALGAKMRSLFGRSLRLRSVAAGSCGGCEAELVALGNVVFDLARFGVQFVASPRHADGLVITGAVNVNMRDALERTFAATPDPKLVIAVGACAINGGPFRESGEAGAGVGSIVPVDLWIAGCPPHPITMLDGLLRLLGRIDSGRSEHARPVDSAV